MRKFSSGLALILLLSSCTTMWQEMSGGSPRKGVSSSLVDYLYPKGEEPPPPDNTVPHLNLPLKVGLAFVPSRDAELPGLSEAHKAHLLARVKAAFVERDFIREIEIIPDTYLKSRQGFQTIDQVARLYRLDVIALVSYDQVVHSTDKTSSLLYWTIIGAYLVKGSKNDVQTFVDTAIFDVRTHKLLFRAPGIDSMAASSTLINSVEAMRKARENSFSNAMADMTGNLVTELDAFRERIKQDKSVTYTRRGESAGRSGGGGAPDLLGLLLLAVGWRPLRRSRRSAIAVD